MRNSRALRAAFCFLILLAAPALAGELVLEDPLRASPSIPDSLTRLELGSEAYGGAEGLAVRQMFRIQRAFSFGGDWALSLPWIWTDTQSIGHGGRGNLRAGFGGDLPRLSDLRLTGEMWMPFSAPELEPLQVKRGILRWGLQYRPPFVPGNLRLGLSRSMELRGLVGDADEEPLTSWSECGFVWEGLGWKRLELFTDGRLAWREGELLWHQAGGGLRLNWDEHWRLSLGGGFLSDGDSGELPSMALRLLLRRDFPDPVMPVTALPEGEGEAPGETPEVPPREEALDPRPQP